MKTYFTEQTGLFGRSKPSWLLEEFGSPLYLYSEAILRERCREMAGLVSCSRFKPNYSTKANSNPELLKIIRNEGFDADAMSPGEIHILLASGFKPEEIFFVANNISTGEMEYALDKGVLISCDSISQLCRYGRLNPGGTAAVRFNPGIGAGHHEKVITGGENTKFGVNIGSAGEVKAVLKEYGLRLVGINQHIGSLFMDAAPYVAAAKSLLYTAEQFEELEFIDMGGGIGIPYHKQDGQKRMDLEDLGGRLSELLINWTTNRHMDIKVKMEPGRYIVAECGVLLGTVHALKQNCSKTYIGTDMGFNVLMRPAMYDSYHDIELYENDEIIKSDQANVVSVTGNICETGDILAKDRELPPVREGSIIGIMDAGAYGYSMSSNYNCRLRPAEVMIGLDGTPKLIRRRETMEDLMKGCS
jgi:diaminopimelate decarboxylase